MAEIKCVECPGTVTSAVAGRLKHNADGSHTLIQLPTSPRATTDPKPRGRRHG